MLPIFISGTGTDVGKTVVAAILTEALQADYWKPVQAGFADGTDSEWVQKVLTNSITQIHPETYKLKLAASPHIAAREEGINIDLNKIEQDFFRIMKGANPFLVIEGAGGLMVPLNEKEFVIDLIKKINANVIIVSRNYLGSINHSLLTASVCRSNDVRVFGWLFNDQYLNYEEEIVRWTGISRIASVPVLERVDKKTIATQAANIRPFITGTLKIPV